jgi:hypothetical protein
MSLIRKPHQLETTAAAMVLVYGQPGLGKTTLALSAPSPLLIDFDRGAHRVDPAHLTDVVQVKTYQDMIDLLSKEDLSAYKSLVIDTAGQMLEYMGAHIIKNDPKMGRAGSLALQGYGARKTMFQLLVTQARQLGKHLIFVAHDKEEKEGDTKIIRPEIGGSSSGDLIKQLDLVGYMEARDRNRTISFDPQEKFYGKNTCGLDPLYTLPNLKQPKTANTFLTEVLGRFAANLQARNDMAAAYAKLMDEVRAKLDLVVDAETANEFTIWGKTAPHLWDSAIQARQGITAKAKTLGLTWDGKAYVGEVAHAA